MGQGMSEQKPFKPQQQSGRRNIILGGGLVLAVILGAWLLWPKGEAPLPGVTYKPAYVEAAEMLHLAQVLSSDALEGRAAGTAGNEAARGFIHKRFEEIGLLPLPGFSAYTHTFPIVPRDADAAPMIGANLIGFIPGRTPGEGPALLITAHYDHLGIRDGEIYNGADDNASGASALVAVAEYFALNRPQHDIVIAALDAEEIGLLGARALARMEGLDVSRVALNMNFDMVGRSEAGELYVAGTYHTPQLVPVMEAVAEGAPVTLRMGHDRPEDGPNDWTLQSDHGVFHQMGLPILYFGVEDHPGYHNPGDDFEFLTLDFFVRAADTLVMAALAVDAELPQIYALRRTPAAETDQPEGNAE